MRRGPSTFALVLALVALALLLALVLSTALTRRAGRQVLGDSYGRLALATALAADELDTHPRDAGARRALDALDELGVRFANHPPPAPSVRLAPAITAVGRTASAWLGDPSRVVVTQTPASEVWVRSSHDPRRWIVLTTASYRQRTLASTALVSLLAGLIALAAAAIGARVLVRPLERLARQAPAWLAGEPLRDALDGSPREVRRLAAAVGQAGDCLRAAGRERELLLAGISHDLRTPLARLRLALELGDGADPARCAAMIDDLEQLDGALEQCLAFVRDGRDEPLRDTDLATVAGQLLALRAHPDDWRLDGPPVLLARVRPSLLRRALGNLMDNAERHGAAPFTVTLGHRHDGLFARVEDRGAGVETDLLARLGQPFLRGNAARTGSGSGLGLSIARRAAELHGGRLELRNRADGGLAATLYLPDALSA